MAFDGGMLRSVINELKEKTLSGRIEKIYQPQADEIILSVRQMKSSCDILINTGSIAPRLSIAFQRPENPASPPMFCMSMRKHLLGGKILNIEQIGFDRIAKFSVETRDEMGFLQTVFLYAELMGKYSNVLMTDSNGKIINVLKPVSFSDSQIRQLLPGLIYEAPPSQNKLSPLDASEEDFIRAFDDTDKSRKASNFITSVYDGISVKTASEIVFLSGSESDALLFECERDKLWNAFSSVFTDFDIKPKTASVVREGSSVVDYSFIPIKRYFSCETVLFDSPSEAIEEYFKEKVFFERNKRKAHDLYRILDNAKNRIEKKISIQTNELIDCDNSEKYRKFGDLITANIYKIEKGADSVTATDWESGEEITVELDKRYFPSKNAQLYYKKYAKLKRARQYLTVQIENSQNELVYIESVRDALTRAEKENEINEIKRELIDAGYGSKMKKGELKKKLSPTILKFITPDGYTVLVGKNNTANDFLTFKTASKKDMWFHVKSSPGSHVVLQAGEDDSFSDESMNFAAKTALYFSSLRSSGTGEVEYLPVKGVKKPPNSKPGFVIYHEYSSAQFKLDREFTEIMEKQAH